MKNAIAILTVTLLVSVQALAGDVAIENTVFDADNAFEAMKRFEGTWVGKAIVVQEGQSLEDGVESETKVTYRNIANDTSIIATYREGTPMEMVSVYHQDGNQELIHTHYCAAGNQPKMRFEKTDQPGVIRFMFTSGTNMDVTEDGHVHNSTFRVIDENTIRTESDLWNGGKKTSTRIATLTRQK